MRGASSRTNGIPSGVATLSIVLGPDGWSFDTDGCEFKSMTVLFGTHDEIAKRKGTALELAYAKKVGLEGHFRILTDSSQFYLAADSTLNERVPADVLHTFVTSAADWVMNQYRRILPMEKAAEFERQLWKNIAGGFAEKIKEHSPLHRPEASTMLVLSERRDMSREEFEACSKNKSTGKAALGEWETRESRSDYSSTTSYKTTARSSKETTASSEKVRERLRQFTSIERDFLPAPRMPERIVISNNGIVISGADTETGEAGVDEQVKMRTSLRVPSPPAKGVRTGGRMDGVFERVSIHEMRSERTKDDAGEKWIEAGEQRIEGGATKPPRTFISHYRF